MQFLRLNQIDTYNYGMGSVDIADQLRVFCRPDHWIRNRKWWWSILFWALGVILTNSYVLYIKICDDKGLGVKWRQSHYEFLQEVGMYWLNPDIADQVSVDFRKTSNPLSSPSGSTVLALTNDSVSTPVAKRC